MTVLISFKLKIRLGKFNLEIFLGEEVQSS